MSRSKHVVWLLEGAGVFLLALGFLLVQQAAPLAAQDGTPQPTGDDSFCLTCHANTDATTTLADGTVIHIGVDRDVLDELGAWQRELRRSAGLCGLSRDRYFPA